MTNTTTPKNLYWLLLTILVIILDQLSKTWVTHTLTLNESITITPFFKLTLKYNLGAAFSFLSGASGWQRWFFSGVALAISIALVIWLLRLKPSQKWLACAIALILAGALSNLYDRLLLGYVIDFLHFHIQQYSWPVFNVADTAISIGAVMLLRDMLFPAPKYST